MTHKEAINSLAAHFDYNDWLVYTEPGIRSDCIPDVMLIKKAYARPDFRIYEVKVKDGDFRQDLQKLKFEKYYAYADRVFFAFGPDVKVDYKKMLEGHPVGIVRYSDKGWRTLRNAPMNNVPKRIDWEMFLALLMNGKLWNGQSRLDRLERHKEFLLKNDIENLTRCANEALSKKLLDARSILDKAKSIEDDARQEVLSQLKEDLGLSNWYYMGTSGTLLDKITQDIVRPKIEELFDELRVRAFPALKPILEEHEKKKMQDEAARAERRLNRDTYYRFRHGQRVEIIELDDNGQITFAKRGKFLRRVEDTEFGLVDIGEGEAYKARMIHLRERIE